MVVRSAGTQPCNLQAPCPTWSFRLCARLIEQVRVPKLLSPSILLTLCGVLLGSSALHSALSISSWALRNLIHSGSATPSDDLLQSHLAQTVHLLVEHTDIDLSAESSEGNTILDRAFQSHLGMPLVGWLSQQSSTDLDVDHRNAEGKTLLMKQVCCATDLPERLDNMKDLLARGAALDARVLDKPKTSPPDIGATALHLAAQFYYSQPIPHFFEKARYLLSQGANPHAKTLTGHTVTDKVLELKRIVPFLHWRKILLEGGFNLEAFVRKEIDAHADVPWYAGYGCDEFVLNLFGFMPKYDVTTGTLQFLTISEADFEPAQDDDLSSSEEEIDLFGDTDSEPAHGSSSDSDYESADEDVPRSKSMRMIKKPYLYRTPSQAVIAIREMELRGGLSEYRSGEPKPKHSLEQRMWQAYAAMLETGDLESWLRERSTTGVVNSLSSYGCLIERLSENVLQ